MPNWQKAWGCFEQALRDRQFPAWCSNVSITKDRKVFRQMVKSIRQAGISVIVVKDLGLNLDNNGDLIHTCGYIEWQRLKNPKPQDIRILISSIGQCTRVISHEFAHAADLLLHGYQGDIRRQMELVATVAGYLFACQHLGIHSSPTSLDHTLRWGTNLHELLQKKRRIVGVLRKMNSLYHKGLKTKKPQ